MSSWRPTRAVNLSAGCAALPLEVLEKAQKEFLGEDGPDAPGLSVTEMGYRTKNFYDTLEHCEDSFRKLMNIPDEYEVHFFNGGATLQFAAVPLNLCGGENAKKANYVMSGHWSEKAANEAKMMGIDVHEVCHDPKGLYFSHPDAKEWNFDADARYVHYTAADTRQGHEFQDFPFEAVPEGMIVVADASANLGSHDVDEAWWRKHGVVYAAAHKNFSTSGVCYTVIRKDLIPEKMEDAMRGTPTMCNWRRFQDAEGKIWTVPVVFSIWLGGLTTEWMREKGGLKFFEDLAIQRSNLLYEYIDAKADGFYRTFVTDFKFRSRMQVVFTIRTGEGADGDLVEKFLKETTELGWLDIRSHPLGIKSSAIRVTMYNPQPVEVIEQVRDFMIEFKARNEA
jgi:phosphoserine aminotransferase